MSSQPLVLEIPDLAGDGWRLRAWYPDDAPSLVRAWHDPAVIAGSTPPPDRSEPAARRWIEGCEARRVAGVAVDMVITDEDDEVLGEFGLSRLDAGRAAAVAGWWVHETARGRGVATGAVSAIAATLLAGPLKTILAEIDPANAASIAVAGRAGFTPLPDPRNPQEPARGRGPRVWYVANSTVKRVP